MGGALKARGGGEGRERSLSSDINRRKYISRGCDVEADLARQK